MALPAVSPSVTCHGVGTLIAIMSQLQTLPACAPVNASMAALRLAPHDSGSGWLATPFLYDSLIHYSTPVYPGARRGLLAHFGVTPPAKDIVGRLSRLLGRGNYGFVAVCSLIENLLITKQSSDRK